MKRLKDRTDTGRALYFSCFAVFVGAVVVFLPKLIPPTGFVNTLAQFVAMLMGLVAAASAGLYLERAYRDSNNNFNKE